MTTGRAGFEKQGDLEILLNLGVGAAGASKSGDPGVLEFQLLGLAKELDVLFVGAGPAAFDVVHAEGVEPLGDAEFIRE